MDYDYQIDRHNYGIWYSRQNFPPRDNEDLNLQQGCILKLLDSPRFPQIDHFCLHDNIMIFTIQRIAQDWPPLRGSSEAEYKRKVSNKKRNRKFFLDFIEHIKLKTMAKNWIPNRNYLESVNYFYDGICAIDTFHGGSDSVNNAFLEVFNNHLIFRMTY